MRTRARVVILIGLVGLLVSIAVGCRTSASRPGEFELTKGTSKVELVSTNGIWTNGLSTNGIWTNGIWTNGIWTNGIWTNGIWTNGIWTNGIWTNGIWTNGIWTNGIWTNGIWTNGIWTNGIWTNGIWTNGLAGDAVKSSQYTRQLLQYVYACAMPAPVVPGDGGAPTSYDTTLDPNNGTLACSSQGTCDPGYTCSASNTCVISLTGAIGLGINADGTTWWGSGKCDESCQRWVSACVLARTNAYGVHVNISMRAPNDAPQAIKDALATTSNEVAAYPLREGAYYGNIFATAPVNPAPSTSFSGPTSGPIAETPSFYACAGPDSNIPEITKRFCSSQGDQAVINVPGVCLTNTTEQGTCAGVDTDASSPTFGAIQDCYANTGKTGTEYTQVITVYLQQPISVCGNAVCEPPGESTTSCPSDCHPGTWTKDYPFDINPNTADSFALGRMIAVAPDNTIVAAGALGSDVDLGGGTLSASAGPGVVVKYNPDGSYVWGSRFGNSSPTASGGQLQHVTDVQVAPDGTITVLGQGVEELGGVQYQAISVSTYTANGTPLGSFSLPVGSDSFALYKYELANHAVDSQGNIILAGEYLGTATLGTTSFTSTDAFTSANLSNVNGDTFLAKVSPLGAVLWAQNFGGTGENFPNAVTVDSDDNILLVTSLAGTDQFGTGVPPVAGVSYLQKLSPDGSVLWTQSSALPDAAFFGVKADSNGNVYLTGMVGAGQDFGHGPISVVGGPPFLAKYGPDGSFQWVSYPSVVCQPAAPNCAASGIYGPGAVGAYILLDPAGNPVVVSVGFGAPGAAGIDFGVGTFPMYASPSLFVSAYTPDTGRLLWAKQIPMILNGNPAGAGIDSQGRVVLSGQYAGSMQVDGQLLVTPDPEDFVNDPFIASFTEPSVADTTPPSIGAAVDQSGTPIFTVPANILAPATSSAGAVVFFMPPTAIDNGGSGGGSPGTSVACSPPPNTTFPIGTTTVTCTASDPLGNESSATFTITVADTLGPVFSPVADITAQATSAGGATATYTLAATDQVDGASPVTCTPASGSLFAVGSTAVTCTSSDMHGNTSSVTFTVTIVDTTPPVLRVPPSVTAEATGPSGAVVTYAATATDLVDGTRPMTCSVPSGSTFAIGATTVTCSASDTHGNTSSASFTVTVVDTTPPVLTVPTSIMATATSAQGAVVSYPTSATDIVDGSVTPVCTPASGSTFALGTTTVSCTATNSRGLKASGSFQVQMQYAWSGILRPIHTDGSSIFDLGSTVRVRFALSGASAGITNAGATLTVTKLSSTVVGTHRQYPSSAVPTTGSTFKYNPVTKHYFFNLATNKLSAGTYSIAIDLHDGVSRTAQISLQAFTCGNCESDDGGD